MSSGGDAVSPKEKKNTVRANVFLSEEDHDAIRKIAEREGSNVSLVIRRAVKEYLASQNEQ